MWANCSVVARSVPSVPPRDPAPTMPIFALLSAALAASGVKERQCLFDRRQRIPGVQMVEIDGLDLQPL